MPILRNVLYFASCFRYVLLVVHMLRNDSGQVFIRISWCLAAIGLGAAQKCTGTFTVHHLPSEFGLAQENANGNNIACSVLVMFVADEVFLRDNFEFLISSNFHWTSP